MQQGGDYSLELAGLEWLGVRNSVPTSYGYDVTPALELPKPPSRAFLTYSATARTYTLVLPAVMSPTYGSLPDRTVTFGEADRIAGSNSFRRNEPGDDNGYQALSVAPATFPAAGGLCYSVVVTSAASFVVQNMSGVKQYRLDTTDLVSGFPTGAGGVNGALGANFSGAISADFYTGQSTSSAGAVRQAAITVATDGAMTISLLVDAGQVTTRLQGTGTLDRATGQFAGTLTGPGTVGDSSAPIAGGGFTGSFSGRLNGPAGEELQYVFRTTSNTGNFAIGGVGVAIR